MTRIRQLQSKINYNIAVILLFGLAFVSLFTNILLISPVLAKTDNSIKSKGLTLSPLRNELDITPGTSVDGILKVTNSSTAVMTVNFNSEEFSVINQQYDYAFTDESDIAKWVVFDSNEQTLGVGETKNISYRVGVPLSAEPGGRYISLFASTDTNTVESSINSRQRVASLLYINVTGDVTRQGHLISLNLPWLITGPSKFSMVLRNSGTTHFRSRYTINIRNIISNKTVTEKLGDALILPGTVRAISDDYVLPKLPGIYKVTYMIGLGDTPAITKTEYFLYITPSAMTIIVVFITLIILYILKLKQKKKN